MTTKTSNKPPKSGAIRKGSMKQEEIESIAKELTKDYIYTVVDTVSGKEESITTKRFKELTKVSEIIEEVQAPAIEPIVAPGNYEVYAQALQAMINKYETVTVSKRDLAKIFPQNKHAKNIAQNLKRTYGIEYRSSDANGGEYVFFDGETKDETIERLEKEMEELITEKNNIVTENYLAIQEKKDLQEKLKKKQSSLNVIDITSAICIAYALVRLYLYLNGL